eukprot:s786_g7.t1
MIYILHYPQLKSNSSKRTSRAALLRSALSALGTGCAQRSVLLDGPAGTGPVQMPRITETEFRMRTKLPRGPAFYAAFRRETEKVVQECFLLDWNRAKVARLVSKDTDRQDTQQLLASNYRKLVALYRDLSCIGTTGETGFGVTQLEASALLTQAGLVDDTTRTPQNDLVGSFVSDTTRNLDKFDLLHNCKVSDIDRCFIAAEVLPVDMRKAGVRLANDKVLNRHQFLELLLRVADQRYVQTGRVKSVSEALSQVLEPLLPVGQAKVAEVDAILDALHTDEARRFFEFALFLRRVRKGPKVCKNPVSGTGAKAEAMDHRYLRFLRVQPLRWYPSITPTSKIAPPSILSVSMELSSERDLGCSVFIQNGNARLSGACAALQCSLGGDAWAGPGMTGSSPPTRETGVTNTATASWTNFTVVEISGERIECVPLPNRRL